jgi:hypothetical protein
LTIWRLLRAALGVPLLLGGLVLVTAEPAAACTCYGMSEADRVARYDAVFVGRLVSHVIQIDPRYEAAQREFTRTSDLAPLHRAVENNSSRSVWTFQVSRVYKGAVRRRQEIITPPGAPGGSNCSGVGSLGLRHPGTEPFVVFAYASSWARVKYRLQPGQYASNSCSGSRPLADGGEPATGGLSAREPSGPDRPPSPPRGGLLAGASGGSDSSPPSTRGGLQARPASSPSPASVALGVGLLAAGAAAGLGLVRVRARRRASAD